MTMFHVGFWVQPAEVDRTLDFYADLLGYEPVSRKPRKSGGERIFLRNSEMQYLEVLVSDDAQQLTHFPQHPKERVVGVTHLCFEIPDLDEARATAERLGAEIIMQAPGDGSFGKSEVGEHRILFVQAPAGITVELFEFKERIHPGLAG
jgi:catechol 2,3-dioxygenase-like lactoylglutathione lyase family enzyme